MISQRPDKVRFNGRTLFLTEDTSLIRRQLEATGDTATQLEDELAQRLATDDLPLMNNISTDEITPGWVCFHYDETLGQYVYVGMRDGAVKKDEIRNGAFAVVVSGLSKGCGSSRETAILYFIFFDRAVAHPHVHVLAQRLVVMKTDPARRDLIGRNIIH